jgi:hypothetical protein
MKKKTFASLSHSRQAGSLGKPFALVFLLGVLFVLAATQAADGRSLGDRQSTGRGFGALAAATPNAGVVPVGQRSAQP